MRESIKYPIIRHLEDEDNLFEKRDGILIHGQETTANEIADTIYSKFTDKHFSILLFVTSSKRRAIQTAEIVAKSLQPRVGKTRIIRQSERLLNDQDQGDIILPANYKIGDRFGGFVIASKIFQKETFGNDYASQDNLTYHFGDPLLQTDGTYKYPELLKYFSRRGESYRDVMVRILSTLIHVSKNVIRFKDKKILPIVFTHSQSKQIFKDLQTIVEQYERGEFDYKIGQLGRNCWDMYRKRKATNPKSDQVEYVVVDALLRKDIIDILRTEIDYLKAL